GADAAPGAPRVADPAPTVDAARLGARGGRSAIVQERRGVFPVNQFSAAETAACCHLVELALREDLGPHASVHHDVTSEQYIPGATLGRAAFVVRKPGVLAGLPAAELVCTTVDPRLQFERHKEDGAAVGAGDRVATVAGRMQSILAA